MVSTITSGYTKKCKESIGGISDVYLFPYVKYSRSQIITTNNILTSFPQTNIFRFVPIGNPASNENQENSEGGKFYNQSFTLDLQYKNDAFQLEKLLKKDYRLIIKDRNNIYKIYGLYNGLEANGINYTTGGSKSESNSFKIDFIGKEEKESFFINDLEEAGFFNADFNYRITQDGSFRITQNDEFRILQ